MIKYNIHTCNKAINIFKKCLLFEIEMAEKERIMLNREDRVKKQKREMAERNRKLAELVAAMEEEEEEMEEEEEEREVDVVPEPQPGPGT